jgi:hypothetical protein
MRQALLFLLITACGPNVPPPVNDPPPPPEVKGAYSVLGLTIHSELPLGTTGGLELGRVNYNVQRVRAALSGAGVLSKDDFQTAFADVPVFVYGEWGGAQFVGGRVNVSRDGRRLGEQLLRVLGVEWLPVDFGLHDWTVPIAAGEELPPFSQEYRTPCSNCHTGDAPSLRD